MTKQQAAAEALLKKTTQEWEQKVEAEKNVTEEVKKQAIVDRSELQAQHEKAIKAMDEQLLAIDLKHEVGLQKHTHTLMEVS